MYFFDKFQCEVCQSPEKTGDRVEYGEPHNDIERLICLGLEEVLHCDMVGVDDDFFKLGGDSINVLKLVEYLKSLALTPEMVFKGRTPRGIAHLVEKRRERGPKRMIEERAEYPLTDLQTGIYLEYAIDPETTMHNLPMCCKLPESFDKGRFREAVRKAVAMHTSFSVNVALSNGIPVMRLYPEFLDAKIEEWETEDIEATKASFVEPFCLEGEPLYRMALCKCKHHWYFLFDVHHIIFDDVSIKVFLHEISLFYSGKKPEAEEISLTDMALYEETIKEMPQYRAAQEYFKGRLTGKIPIMDDKKELFSARSGEVRLLLSDALSCDTVESFVRQKEISENTLFLGAFSYVIGKIHGENKSLFCTVDPGRHTPNLTQSTGMFVRTLPICHSFHENVSVEEYLQEFQNDFYELQEHDCITFGELARDYGIASDILFVYQGEMLSGLTLDKRQYPVEPISTRDVKADIFVRVGKNQDGYGIFLQYRVDLYSKEIAEKMLAMLERTLLGMISCETLNQILPN